MGSPDGARYTTFAWFGIFLALFYYFFTQHTLHPVLMLFVTLLFVALWKLEWCVQFITRTQRKKRAAPVQNKSPKVRRITSPTPSLVSNLVLLGITLVALFIVGEVALRATGFDETSWYGFNQVTSEFYDTVKTNSRGFRDVEHALEKPSNTLRVALVGDSFVFGSPIEDDNALFANIIRKNVKTSAEGKSIEFFNLGAPGSNTAEQLTVLAVQNYDYQFDKIMLFFFPNDLEFKNSPKLRKHYEHIIPGAFGNMLHENSLFYYFLESRLYRILEKMGVRESYGQYMLDFYEPHSPQLRQHSTLMHYFLQTVNREDIIFVIIPVLNDFDNYKFETAHNYMKGFGRRYHFEVIDLRGAFPNDDAQDLIVGTYDYHFNEYAHARVGEYLTVYLQQSQFLLS